MENKQAKATTRVNKNKQPKKGPRTSGAKPSKEAMMIAGMRNLEAAIKSKFGNRFGKAQKSK